MLDAVTAEHADGVVVHLDGKVDGKLALARAQDGARTVVQSQPFGGGVELREGSLECLGNWFCLRLALLHDHSAALLPL
jgi:hypothetical protein